MISYPKPFLDMLGALPGYEGVAEAMSDTESPVAIRLNPAKPLADAVAGRAVPWEPAGRYLSQRPRFTFHPALYDGRFYVQDPSSMILGEAVRRIVARGNGMPLNYLDACAAPGGKTTAAIAALPTGSFVLANEFESDRAAALVENLQRWGTGNYAVSRGDACSLSALGEVFDIVAADVPCSGEGMMRKNDTAVSQWSANLVQQCAALQRRIVESVWSTLRPGGWLIYSTCTFNTVENEDNARWIRDHLGAMPVDLGLADFPGVLRGINTDIPCARFAPGLVDGEGQFIAVFRKPDDAPSAGSPRLVMPKKTTPLPTWLDGDFIGMTDRQGDLYAISRSAAPLVNHLISKANIIIPGLHVATPKGRDIMPAHALATSVALRNDAFPAVSVDYATAIAYLRGEAIQLPEGTPRGFTLITHSESRLGWAKNIGRRANNLLPASRRIRSSHAPATCPTLT